MLRYSMFCSKLNTSFSTLTKNFFRNGLGLYVHLPFCSSRCLYCNCITQIFQPCLARSLLEILPRHLENIASFVNYQCLDKLYFGGGTPSMWPAEALASILLACKLVFLLDSTVEVTIEANPSTLSRRKLDLLRQAGFNRLSLGVQTFSPTLLKILGRQYYDIQRVINEVRAAGFSNLNLDLIYGLPNQDAAQAEADIKIALEFMPEHLSLYELTLEPGTVFNQKYVKGYFPLPADDELIAWEERAFRLIAAAGFVRYEVSNFARPGYECRYNQTTWRGGDYLALGPGAHGHLSGRRWSWIADVKEYIHFIKARRNPFAYIEDLTPAQRALELIMLGLRTVEGVDLKQVEILLGVNPLKFWAKAFQEIQELGWGHLIKSRFIPTPSGLRLADSAAAFFISY